MGRKIEAPTPTPSLLLLPEFCILEIFEFLKLHDSLKLVLSCSRLRYVANRIFKKHSHLTLDSRTINKGEEHIDYVFSFIGQHVSSLSIDCGNVRLNWSKNLYKIINKCTNLKSVIIINWRRNAFQNVSPVYCFDNVDRLTLYQCNHEFTNYLLENFRKLKSFNVLCSSIEYAELRAIFQRNPSIKSFVWRYHEFETASDFNCKLLELIPHLERLDLHGDDCGNILRLDSLSKLSRLTKLRIDCQHKNVNNVLRELAKNGIMNEMILLCVETNGEFFDVLTSFDKLQLLVIKSSVFKTELHASIAWPTKLKHLLLEDFEFTYIDFIAMIQQLNSIENIDLRKCDIMQGEITNFNDVTKLSHQLIHIIDHSNRKQRLDVTLPECVKHVEKYLSKKYLVNLERLRILRWSSEVNPLNIRIHFPDL